jgi:hypothetical protein
MHKYTSELRADELGTYHINIMTQKVIYYHVNIISKKVICDSYHIIYP